MQYNEYKKKNNKKKNKIKNYNKIIENGKKIVKN